MGGKAWRSGGQTHHTDYLRIREKGEQKEATFKGGPVGLPSNRDGRALMVLSFFLLFFYYVIS